MESAREGKEAMTEYRYKAVDDDGSAVNGTMEAESGREVTRRLQERGLTVSSVEKTGAAVPLMRVSKQLTWEELLVFTEQLQTISKSDLPLAPSLKSLAADLRSSRLKPVLEQMGRDIENGHTLEETIGRQHDAFPRLFAPMIRAGERTGNLSGVLHLLCTWSDHMVSFKNTIKVNMAYPIMVILAAAAVLLFLLLKVVPVFGEIFQDFGGALPAPTRFWINTADFLRYHWTESLIAMAALMAVIVIIRQLLRRSDSGRYWLDTIRLHVPWLGKLYYLQSLSRFCHTFALLLKAEVPALESLELSAAASGCPQLERAIEEARPHIAGGERISDALAQTGFFGHNFCWLLATSEERGEAEAALDNLADIYDRELKTSDRMLGVVFGPVCIVITGLIVASIVFSMYLPIFTLGDSII
jgi:type IV pilus assembly protein PilC